MLNLDGLSVDDRAAYLATCAERQAAYAAHLATMALPEELRRWAAAMIMLHGPQVQVHAQVVDWPTALLLVRYGEDVAHWPATFSPDDLRRASRWLGGAGPDARTITYLGRS